MKKSGFLVMISLAIVLAIAVFLLAEPASAETVDRYGYSLLENNKQRTAYEAIADGISSLTPVIKFSCSGISPEDVQLAGEMISRDYPEFFWYDGGAEISVTGDEVTFTPAEYKVNGQTVTADSPVFTAAKSQLEATINNAMKMLPNNPSQYEIAHTFHDYVVSNVSYEKIGDHQTAYGALVSGKAVCAGYARAFQLLMNRAGVQCWYVAGDSYDPNGSVVPHAWNLYWLDGKCYYSDATWDDQGEELFHEYLNMSLEEISKTHYTSDTLPNSCGHNDYTFFMMNGGKGVCDIRDHKTAKEVAKCFEIKSQDGEYVVYYCTIHYHNDDFYDWINSAAGEIVHELGFKSVEDITIIELGHEHHVTISGQLKTAPAPTTKPTEPAPTTKPTEPAPTTKPTEPAPTTKPTEPAPTTKPTEPAPTTKPTEPVPTTKPTEPAPTTKPTEPVPTTTPTEPVPTTKPTEPVPTTKPTEPAPTTKPTEPAPTTKPLEPSPTINPTDSAPTTATTVPAQATDPTTQATGKPVDPSNASVPISTAGTTEPVQPGNDIEDDSGKTIVIVGICLVAAVGIAVFFFVVKKK